MVKRNKLIYDKRDAVALALNICLVVFEIIGIYVRLSRYDDFGFEFYTQDSNLLMLIVAAMACFFLIRKILKKQDWPKWFSILKYTATLALLLTHLVVMFVLAPMMGFPVGYELLLFRGSVYYTHLICPILAIISFCIFEKHDLSRKIDPFLAMIYTLVYAVIMIFLNIIHVVIGPYPFLMIYAQSVLESILWIVGILGSCYLLALALKFLRARK